MLWGLDDCGCETRCDMPFNVAMKELDTRVRSLESQDDVAVTVNTDDISHHGLGISCRGVVCGIGATAGDDLELMAVQMPWVLERSLVVDHNLNDVIVAYDEWVDLPVDGGVVPHALGCGQGSVQSWHMLRQVSDVVDDSASNVIDEAEVEVQYELLCDGSIKLDGGEWLESEVIRRGSDGVEQSSRSKGRIVGT